MAARFPPPYAPLDSAAAALADPGFVVLRSADVCAVAGRSPAELDELTSSWSDLPLDAHLLDGGRYRRRRHTCLVVDGETARAVPHRAHWQPEEYNALHGGIERLFEPIEAGVLEQPSWTGLLIGLGRLFGTVREASPWFVEAHQFRIDTSGGIGRPTPEGAHRDGVDFVAVIVVGMEGLKGGETRVFDAAGPRGQRFTLSEPWSALLLDDSRVIHETTPIQPLGDYGYRDTLVLTYRAGGFQAPAET